MTSATPLSDPEDLTIAPGADPAGNKNNYLATWVNGTLDAKGQLKDLAGGLWWD